MIGQILAIARNTFVESIRQPIFFVFVMLSGILQILTTAGAAFSMGYTTTAEVSGDNKLLLDVGLANVYVLGMLLTALTATAVVSREIEVKTVLTVVSKPISRPAVIIGKYLGAAASIMVAVLIMLAFLLMAIRHGVMSTAADTLDGPVLVFSLSAVALALAAGIWGNFFYGWYFSQTVMSVLLPLIIIAYVLVLFIGKDWHLQPLTQTEWLNPLTDLTYDSREDVLERLGPGQASLATEVVQFVDFKPQIMLACGLMALSMLLLTAIATAISTRLGQVMTVVVLAGVFLLGLLSNHLVGRHAFENTVVAEVATARPANPEHEPFNSLGDTYFLQLAAPPTGAIEPGTPIYYGPDPSGLGIRVLPFPATDPTDFDPDRLLDDQAPGRVLVTSRDDVDVTIRNVGGRPAPVIRPPRDGDFLFTNPTRVNPLAWAVWAVTPNMHYFWVVDAVTQNRPVPPRHATLVVAYSILQILGFLALGMALFQRRDVG